MIVPQDYAGSAPKNVLTLRNPISPDALVQAVRVRMRNILLSSVFCPNILCLPSFVLRPSPF